MADRNEYWKKRWSKQKEEGTTDRHDYWKKRWEEEKSKSISDIKPKSKKKSKSKKDRHRKGYYHDYNQAHGTAFFEQRFHSRHDFQQGNEGYVNGNVSEGPKKKLPNYPDGCLEILEDGYYIDNMGWKRHINPITDALLVKEQEWHDDDWDEGSWDD